jgi:hypothetical protein
MSLNCASPNSSCWAFSVSKTSIRVCDQKVPVVERDMLRAVLASCEEPDRRSSALQSLSRAEDVRRRCAIPEQKRGILPGVDIVKRLVGYVDNGEKDRSIPVVGGQLVE